MSKIVHEKPTADEGRQRDYRCASKAQARGDITFTLVGQDKTAAKMVCLWIAENIETCPAEKLYDALQSAIAMRNLDNRKDAD